MRYYETLYIINPDLPEDGYREVVTKFTDLVEKHRVWLPRLMNGE